MKKTTFLSALLLTVLTFSACAQVQPVQDPAYYLTCENNNHPFRVVDGEGYGQFTVTGPVVFTEAPAPFSEEIVTYARISVLGSDPEAALEYFQNMVKEGNSINSLNEWGLMFNLGLVEDGKLRSSASITPAAEQEIFASEKTNQAISLKLTVPIYEGMGAPDDFSFACAIEVPG